MQSAGKTWGENGELPELTILSSPYERDNLYPRFNIKLLWQQGQNVSPTVSSDYIVNQSNVIARFIDKSCKIGHSNLNEIIKLIFPEIINLFTLRCNHKNRLLHSSSAAIFLYKNNYSHNLIRHYWHMVRKKIKFLYYSQFHN